MKFTYAVTVCNESKELYSLLAFLKKVKDPEGKYVVPGGGNLYDTLM